MTNLKTGLNLCWILVGISQGRSIQFWIWIYAICINQNDTLLMPGSIFDQKPSSLLRLIYQVSSSKKRSLDLLTLILQLSLTCWLSKTRLVGRIWSDCVRRSPQSAFKNHFRRLFVNFCRPDPSFGPHSSDVRFRPTSSSSWNSCRPRYQMSKLSIYLLL